MSHPVATPKTLDRVRALLARAAHPTTPEEEARTSSFQAAKLIARHGLVLAPSSGRPVYSVRVEVRPEPGEPWEEEAGYRHFRVYTAAKAGTCQECRKGFRKGERVGWRNPIGPVHLGC